MKNKKLFKKLMSLVLSTAILFSVMSLPSQAIVPGEDTYPEKPTIMQYDVESGTLSFAEEVPDYYNMYSGVSLHTALKIRAQETGNTKLLEAIGIDSDTEPEEDAYPEENGDAGLLDVIGKDDRESPTESNPYSGVVLIIQTFDEDEDGEADDFTMATGFMVAENIMVTAMHAMHPDYLAMGIENATVIETYVYQGVDVQRALSGSNHLGYLTVLEDYDCAEISSIKFAREFFVAYEARYDWCIATLTDSFDCDIFDIGIARAGTYGLENTSATISGYPRESDDEDNVIEYDYCFYQKMAEGLIRDVNESEGIFTHQIDTGSGQSGGPVFIKDEFGGICYGIHSRGNEAAGVNIACSITESLYNEISALIDP